MIKRINQKIAATYPTINKSRRRASKNLVVVQPTLSVLEQPVESSINRLSQAFGTGQVKRDSYNGEVKWVVGNEVSKM